MAEMRLEARLGMIQRTGNALRWMSATSVRDEQLKRLPQAVLRLGVSLVRCEQLFERNAGLRESFIGRMEEGVPYFAFQREANKLELLDLRELDKLENVEDQGAFTAQVLA